MTNMLRPILASFLLVLVLLVGVAVVDPFAEATIDGDGDQVTRQAALFEGNGNYITLNDGAGTNEEVLKTTGFAVNLTGSSDSYVQSQSTFNIANDSLNAALSGDDPWTISVWAHVDGGNLNEDMAAVSANGRATIEYRGSEGNWRGWYYDEGSTDSYVVNVSTSGNEVGNFTNVMLWNNGTHLTIYRNNTQGEIVDISESNVANVTFNSTNWDGRLEELRTFNEALGSGDRSTIVSQPVEQLPDSSPTSRAMFDQPSKSTQLLLYTDTSLETSNVTYASGFSRQVMQSDDNLLNGDYRWEETGPQIAPISGSELDDAPAAYVNYTFSSTGLKSVVDSWATFTEVASLIPLIAIAIVIITILARIRQG